MRVKNTAVIVGAYEVGGSFYQGVEMRRFLFPASGAVVDGLMDPIPAILSGNAQANGLYAIPSAYYTHCLAEANRVLGYRLVLKCTFASWDLDILQTTGDLLTNGLLAQITAEDPDLVFIDIGLRDLVKTERSLVELQGDVREIIDHCRAEDRTVVLITQAWDGTTGSMVGGSAILPSPSRRQDLFGQLLAYNEWLRRLARTETGVYCHDHHAYIVDPTSPVHAARANATGQSYLATGALSDRAGALVSGAALAETLLQIVGPGPSQLPDLAISARAESVYSNLDGDLTGLTLHGVTQNGDGQMVRAATTSPWPPANWAGPGTCCWKIEAGQWWRRQLSTGQNLSLRGLRVSYRHSSWGADCVSVAVIGPYAVKFDPAAQAVSLHDLLSWPGAGTDFTSANIGAALDSWPCELSTDGKGEMFVIDIRPAAGVNQASVSIYRCRESLVVVEGYTGSGLTFENFGPNPDDTMVGLAVLSSSNVSNWFGAYYVQPIVDTGNVLTFDPVQSAFAAPPSSFVDWSGDIPADLAAVPLVDRSEHSTMVSSAVVRGDGNGNNWKIETTLSAPGSAAVSVIVPHGVIPRRVYRAAMRFRVYDLTTPVMPNLSVSQRSDAGWRIMNLGDYDTGGNVTPNLARDGITAAMDEEQSIATAMFTCNPGDHADLELSVFFTTGAAGSFTVELTGVSLVDVTEAYLAAAQFNGLDLDFAGNRYALDGDYSSTAPEGFVFSRSSPATALTTGGDLVEFAADEMARTDRGVLLQSSRTNLFLNSLTPVTRTVTLGATGDYVLSVLGSGSATVAAGTAVITNAGSASEGAPRTVNCSTAGTVTVTISGSPEGVQLEAGAYATSLIVTTASSSTRAADGLSQALSVSASQDFTIYAEVEFTGSPAAIPLSRHIFNLHDGSASNRVYVARGGNQSSLQLVVVSGGVSTGLGTVAKPGDRIVKVAVTRSGTTYSFYCDGALVVSTSAPALPDLVELLLGNNPASGGPLNDYIRRVTYEPVGHPASQMIYRTT
jgi:hypothetical protein